MPMVRHSGAGTARPRDAGTPDEAMPEEGGPYVGGGGSRAAKRNQRLLVAASLAGLLVSVVLTMVLGRALPPAAFGFVALVGAVLTMARDLTDLGSGSVAAAMIAAEPAREAAILGELLGLRMVLAGAAALGCLGLAAQQTVDGQGTALVLVAGAVLILPLLSLATVFQVRQAQHHPALLSLAGQVAALAVCLALAALQAAAAVFVVVLALRDAAVAVATWRAGVRRLAGRLVPRRTGVVLLRRCGGYGLAALCFGLAVQGSPLLVGLLAPPEVLGAYAAAFRPVAPLLALPWVLAAPLVPALAAARQADPGWATRRIAEVLRLGLGLGAVVVVAGQGFAATALGVLYGGRFLEGPLASVMPLRFLAIVLAATLLSASAVGALLAAGRIRVIVALAIACLLLAVAGSVVLVPAWGATGAAMALAGATGLIAMVSAACVLRPAAHKAHLLPVMLLPAAALAVAVHLLPSEGWLHIVGGGIACLGAVVAAVWLAGALRSAAPGTVPA